MYFLNQISRAICIWYIYSKVNYMQKSPTLPTDRLLIMQRGDLKPSPTPAEAPSNVPRGCPLAGLVTLQQPTPDPTILSFSTKPPNGDSVW